ncbi:hypothetical protein GGTG_14264, partial [Gaeumannomyces tritici R3-111a-1]
MASAHGQWGSLAAVSARPEEGVVVNVPVAESLPPGRGTFACIPGIQEIILSPGWTWPSPESCAPVRGKRNKKGDWMLT